MIRIDLRTKQVDLWQRQILERPVSYQSEQDIGGSLALKSVPVVFRRIAQEDYLMQGIQSRYPPGPAERQRYYFLNSRSNASRASIALRGAGAFTPGIDCLPPFCPDTSRATVTRGENSAHSFA